MKAFTILNSHIIEDSFEILYQYGERTVFGQTPETTAV